MSRIARVIALVLAAGAGCATHATSDLDQSAHVADRDDNDNAANVAANPMTASNPGTHTSTEKPTSSSHPGVPDVDSNPAPPTDTAPGVPAKPPMPAEKPAVSTDPEPCVDLCDPDPDELCFQFRTHGAIDKVDDSSYAVPPGEEYVQFYFDAPWEDYSVGTRIETMFDNQAILHHWRLFTTQATNVEGYSEVVPSPTLNRDGAVLLATWAVGGSNLQMPADVGLELPDNGSKLAVQWHYYNTSTTEQNDRSAVQVCTVPASRRPHVASITYTGTEDLNGNKWTGGAGMPPHQMSTFSGTCVPQRAGLDDSQPIHIVGFWPKMGQFGVELQAIVHHPNGADEIVFDRPFDYVHQITFLHDYELAPGDTLTTKCDYNNTSDVGVPFGDTIDTETCYDLVIAWPAHTLESATQSWLQIPNTCL